MKTPLSIGSFFQQMQTECIRLSVFLYNCVFFGLLALLVVDGDCVGSIGYLVLFLV